jgi:CHAD domain-containing protein
VTRRLKRKEDLREGLQRISEEQLREMLQVISRGELTAEMVHGARKIIKCLRAILRLASGALPGEVRKRRNQALRDLADRLSGPRDAAVTLAAFEKACRESLKNNSHSASEPRWVDHLQRSLAAQAHALVPAESYQEAAQGVRRLGGPLLLFEDRPRGPGPSQSPPECEWDQTVADGLRKTYRQGRRLLLQVSANPQSPEEQWHELRKRAKDLGYQLALLKKVKGVKPLLGQLDEVGSALGDARDLSLLRDYLGKVEDKEELTLAERQSYQHLLTHIEGQRHELHRRALKTAQRVYRRKGKRFTGQIVKRGRQWQAG